MHRIFLAAANGYCVIAEYQDSDQGMSFKGCVLVGPNGFIKMYDNVQSALIALMNLLTSNDDKLIYNLIYTVRMCFDAGLHRILVDAILSELEKFEFRNDQHLDVSIYYQYYLNLSNDLNFGRSDSGKETPSGWGP